MTDRFSVTDSELRSRSVRGGSALVVGQMFRFALSMVSQIYLARMLLPADFGLIAMVYPVMGFVQLFADFGLLQAVVQKKTLTQSLLSTVFWINIAISLALALLFAALTPVLMWMYGEARLGPIALALSALILVSGLGQLQGALLSRQLRFGAIVIVDIVSLGVGLVVGIVSARHGHGYWALVHLQIAATCTTTLLNVALMRWRPSAARREPEVLAMLKFGGQVTGSKVVSYLNATVDNMMIGVALGGTALGIYDRAWRLAAQPLAQLSAPIDRLAMPVLSRLQDDPARYARTFGQLTQLLCLMAMPGLLYGVVAADRFIPALLGAQWTPAIPVFSWICFGALISPLNNAAFLLFASQSRGADHLRFSVIASLINIAAYAAGLYWGPVGVARASALSVYLLQCPILVLAATRTGPVDRRAFVASVRAVVIAIAATAPLLYWAMHGTLGKSVPGLIAGVMLSYAAVGTILIGFPEGRATVALAWGLLPARVRQIATAAVPARLRREHQR